ncbi:MAG: thiamine phosphate synthase [Sphingomonas sp.]|jgi:thiamine-phosphate pyrophosphorylase|uniref:thiamine phosphate synthase n=1 Tax=Sphingomonas sp. TaxID=28214 RepID=UPI000DBC0BDB|nr:thiamine phosphate synthase [Sphingomonas sp.]PZU77905.1 MAG: thiamine phosphate synthase [Sphingomonas sp.]
MRPRHPIPTPIPTRWLMTDERLGEGLWQALERLPRGGGVVFRHYRTAARERRALFERVVRVARRRHLTVVAAESRGLRRADGTHHHVGFGMVTWPVHDAREAVRARRAGADVLFVSPLFPTRSHPGARAKGPVRARLAAGRGPGVLIALGGMDERRFRRVRPLGFAGYAAIDAWAAGPASGQKRKAVPT